MKKRNYSAGAVKHAFWFMEFRKVVTLRYEGRTWEEIKKASEEENLLEYSVSKDKGVRRQFLSDFYE